MIISVNGREKKIAILDNGRVSEFYIERGEENTGIAGNIYKGRVQRVLPGMQSAFVAIGLERDAFLYVSDFFDEEEEIERIVMEKSKKVSPEEARREADERIERARVEREKQMESVQELAEPLAASEPEQTTEQTTEEPEDRKGRGRGKRGRDAEQKAARPAFAEEEPSRDAIEPSSVFDNAVAEPPHFEIDDSGFERVVDDETGEMFKDAYMQEAIVDRVRAIEFDMESTAAAEVGSVLGSVSEPMSGFERIADDDEGSDEPKAKKPAAKRGRKSAKKDDAAVTGEAAEKPAGKSKSAKGRSARGRSKKAAEVDASAEESDTAAPKGQLADSEASVRETADISEMTVRRGGRGRRRGGRNRRPGQAGEGDGDGDTATLETDEEPGFDGSDDGEDGNNPVEETAPPEVQEVAEAPKAAPEPKRQPSGRRDRRDERPPKGDRPDNRERSDSRERSDNRDRPDNRERPDNRGRSQGDNGRRNDRRDRGPQPTISDLLREGQEILVQIAKEPIARKGARITSHIALPGRFLVYMPTIEHLGVSRKIESASERGRLRTLIQRIRAEEEIPSGGFIVRTAGVGIAEDELRQDARYLVRTWLDIKKTSEKAKSPAVVHQDLDIVQRLLRDQLSDDFAAIRCDSEEEYLRTVEFINRIQPRLVNRVKLYTREEPILEAFGVQEEIDKALKPRVWLRSGGYLVINQTEALVAIDVNTGKFVGKGNARLEDTITKTNMEAVDEIARQIRLRDLGGIIVLDLIDMEDRRNRHKVSQALQEALQHDKSPTKVLSFNDFGLIIMTRKRVKQSLERTMCSPCEYCEGAGWVKSPQTVCYEILSEARRLSKQLDDVRQTTLRVHPEVAKALRSTERAVLEEIEAHLTSVDVTADQTIHQAQFDFAFV